MKNQLQSVMIPVFSSSPQKLQVSYTQFNRAAKSIVTMAFHYGVRRGKCVFHHRFQAREAHTLLFCKTPTWKIILPLTNCIVVAAPHVVPPSLGMFLNRMHYTCLDRQWKHLRGLPISTACRRDLRDLVIVRFEFACLSHLSDQKRQSKSKRLAHRVWS